ncbi:MAG: type II toxin-antitoxin system HicB family antitoxin [Bryobacteraceae bacterium]
MADAIMKYQVVLERTEEGYSVGCPGLPGCWSQGETEQEALENIRIAIREYLAAVKDSLDGAEVREVEVAV